MEFESWDITAKIAADIFSLYVEYYFLEPDLGEVLPIINRK